MTVIVASPFRAGVGREGKQMLRRLRWPLALAAVLCLTALSVPCSARSRGYSSKSRYSFGSSYSTSSHSRPRKSRALKSPSFSTDLYKGRDSSTSNSLYPSRRKSSDSAFRLSTPRRTSLRPARISPPPALYSAPRKSSESAFRVTTPRRTPATAFRIRPPSLSSHVSYRKSPAAYRVPRASTSQQEYYKNGLPKHRSESAKQEFLRRRGLKRVPAGYEVDHTVPLAAGGSDTPTNMEVLPKSTHHAKTAGEAKRYGWNKKR